MLILEQHILNQRVIDLYHRAGAPAAVGLRSHVHHVRLQLQAIVQQQALALLLSGNSQLGQGFGQQLLQGQALSGLRRLRWGLFAHAGQGGVMYRVCMVVEIARWAGPSVQVSCNIWFKWLLALFCIAPPAINTVVIGAGCALYAASHRCGRNAGAAFALVKTRL